MAPAGVVENNTLTGRGTSVMSAPATLADAFDAITRSITPRPVPACSATIVHVPAPTPDNV